jgi:3-hydroxypropanoate dehydrogenase
VSHTSQDQDTSKNPTALSSAADWKTAWREARTCSRWQARPIAHELLQELYELVSLGPTSMNCQPMRLKFVVSEAAKARLLPALYDSNVDKARHAPVVAVIGMDMNFPSLLPRLFAHKTDAVAYYEGKPELVASTALRNGSLQAGYLMVAARQLGLDCGPMSGFDAQKVDAEFWQGTSVRTNFLCNLGYGNYEGLRARAPRLGFDEACQFV